MEGDRRAEPRPPRGWGEPDAGPDHKAPQAVGRAPPEKEAKKPAEATSWPYEVKAGETLSGLAKRFYGDGSIRVWVAILGANPGLDPDTMREGTKIKLPIINGKKPEGVPEEKEEESKMEAPAPSGSL